MNDDAKTGLPRPMVSHSECPEAISESSRFEPASEEHVIKYESENDDGDDDDDDLKAAESGSGKDESDDEEDPNVCTVHTIADLQNVLKSQEDIQVPVHQSFFRPCTGIYLNNLKIVFSFGGPPTLSRYTRVRGVRCCFLIGTFSFDCQDLICHFLHKKVLSLRQLAVIVRLFFMVGTDREQILI